MADFHVTQVFCHGGQTTTKMFVLQVKFRLLSVIQTNYLWLDINRKRFVTPDIILVMISQKYVILI